MARARIATAQYQPPDTETVVTTNPIQHGNYPRAPNLQRNSPHLAWSDNSASDDEGQHDSDEDDYSDYSEQQKPINFIPTSPQGHPLFDTDVPPTKMLEFQANLLQEGRKYYPCTPLQRLY